MRDRETDTSPGTSVFDIAGRLALVAGSTRGTLAHTDNARRLLTEIAISATGDRSGERARCGPRRCSCAVVDATSQWDQPTGVIG